MSELYLRNLPVPFFSQRENEYIYKERYTSEKKAKLANKKLGDLVPNGKQYSMGCNTCNLTSVCMVLHYYGFTDVTPYSLTKKFFDDNKSYNETSVEDWTKFNKYIEDNYSNKGITTDLFDANSLTISKIQEKIAAGYPVLISIAIDKAKNHGHVVVVRGFTKIGTQEYIILNDSWGSQAKIDNTLAEGSTCYGGYFQNNGDYGNGDNVLIKVNEFKNLILIDKNKDYSTSLTLYRGLSVEGKLWNYPDGSEITDEHNIDSAEIIKGGGFPISANNLWHDGIHLNISNIHSIGPGRLVAARIDEKASETGDNSFLLVKHNFVKTDSAITAEKEFFALYMHIKPFSIKDKIQEYFTTGKISNSFSWLNQIIKNLLPFKFIITKGPSKNEGFIGNTFKEIKIFNATYSNGNFIKGAELSESDLNDYRLGQRMMITPLPANNSQLFAKLLDPKNYNDSIFLKEIGLSKNYIKKIGNDNYLFYYSSNKLLCVKKEYASDTNDKKKIKKFVNENQFRANAERLYNLSEGKITVFSDYARKTTDSNIEKEEYNQVSLIDYFNSIDINKNWGSIDKIDKKDDLTYFLSLLNNLYIQSFGNISENFKEKIIDEIKKIAKKYAEGRINEFKAFLKKLEDINKEVTDDENEDSKKALELFYEKALEILKSVDNSQTLTKGENCLTIANSFIKKISNWDYLNKKYAIEYFIIYLFSINAKEIKGKDYFKLIDKYLPSLLESYSNIFTNDIAKKYFIDEVYLKQIDSFIEIAKNDLIGVAGVYKYEQNLRQMIHFEIFSEDDLLNSSKQNNEIIDTDKDAYFNPAHCVESFKKIFDEVPEYQEKLNYLDDNILKTEEVESFYENVPIIKLYSFKHISEWATNLSFSAEKETGYADYEYIYNQFNDNVEEKINKTDYESIYSKPFSWFEKKVFKNEKSKFSDSNAWYYHPLEFLKQITKNE